VNFHYDDIVHALQNTIDSCIAIPLQIDAVTSISYVSEHKFTKFSEITQCNGR